MELLIKIFPRESTFFGGRLSETLRGYKDDADIPELDVLLWYLTHITKTPGPSPITLLSAAAMLKFRSRTFYFSQGGRGEDRGGVKRCKVRPETHRKW